MSKHEPAATYPDGRVEYRFDNGYGASVIADNFAKTLFEVKVIGTDGNTVYDTTLPDGIFDYLPAVRVDRLLDRIAALPVRAES